MLELPWPQGRGRADGKASMSEQGTSSRMTGAQSLVTALEEAGVEHVFGIPAAPSCRRTTRSSTRPGSGTSWSATSRAPGTRPQGYAMATGRVGVCMATSGPGATNLVTPIADALHGLGPDRRDHRPGRQRGRSAPTPSRRPTSAASRCRSPSTTSWSPTRRDPAPDRRGVPHRLHRPPGPVLVDIAKDALQAHDDVRVADRAPPARLPAGDPPARQADPRGGPADARVAPSGAVRRRRRDPGPAPRTSCGCSPS